MRNWSHDFVWVLSVGRVGLKMVLYMLKRFSYCHYIKNWSRDHTHDHMSNDDSYSYLHKICKCSIINMLTCYSLPCASFDIGIIARYLLGLQYQSLGFCKMWNN